MCVCVCVCVHQSHINTTCTYSPSHRTHTNALSCVRIRPISTMRLRGCVHAFKYRRATDSGRASLVSMATGSSSMRRASQYPKPRCREYNRRYPSAETVHTDYRFTIRPAQRRIMDVLSPAFVASSEWWFVGLLTDTGRITRSRRLDIIARWEQIVEVNQ